MAEPLSQPDGGLSAAGDPLEAIIERGSLHRAQSRLGEADSVEKNSGLISAEERGRASGRYDPSAGWVESERCPAVFAIPGQKHPFPRHFC